MSLTRARVLKAARDAGERVQGPAAGRGPPRGRTVQREVVDAEARAAQIVATAERRAAEILDESHRRAAEVRLRAEAEGRADGAAAVAARALALTALEARADERQLDRTVQLAVVLAERLLGEALALDPERVGALARQALSEARGAQRVTIAAHPLDAPIVKRSLAALDLPAGIALVAPDPGRARGSLRLETEAGVLDADLAPQLERLALKLRESLD